MHSWSWGEDAPFFAIMVSRKDEKNRNNKKKLWIQIFFKKGKFFSGKFLEVFIFENNSIKNRLGIVVSKKVGGSVVRNHIKRYIREAYTAVEDKIDSNINMLIIWNKKVDPELATFFETRDDLTNILKKAGKIKEIKWKKFLYFY